MNARLRPSAWRRLAAFGLDWLVIAAYLGALTSAVVAARRALHLELSPPATPGARFRGQALGMATVTLPTVLYFALCEASAWQATLGKRALGLCVLPESPAGGRSRLPLGRSLVRSAVKFVPWELSHTALWHTPGWPLRPEPVAITYLGPALSLALAGWYVISLFTAGGRTPYDRAAGSRVAVRARC